MLERRTLLKATLAGGASLALPGCASLGTLNPPRLTKSCGPLPVKVSADRVIRTVAGLRPYRASGFVVRAEPLAGKRLVHNYGHGGAGITLSWGSSRLAVDLGLPGHTGPVAVMGAGVMGLTTARLIQEAGFDVTIYAEAMPPHTTSNIAGGQWSPFGHYRKSAVSDAWQAQLKAALDYSWRRFQTMVGADYGIRWLTTYNDREPDKDDPYHPAARALDPAQYPFPVERLSTFDTMYVETGRFLRELMKDIQIAGGRFVMRRFGSAADIAALDQTLVFNCTGLGSRALFNDTELHPIRGQLAVLLPQPEIDYAFLGQMGYMFPRADGILLGGTFERDEWNDVPQPDDIAEIIASHQSFFGKFKCPT